MPRRRPRVGRSTASSSAWEQNATPKPTNDFTLEYEENGDVGYIARLGAAGNFPLKEILSADADVRVRGWQGLAQPEDITVTLNPGAAHPPEPRDFTCRHQHRHRHWTRIDGDGEPDGDSSGRHDHEFGLDEFVSAIYTDPSAAVQKDLWYAVHKHPTA